VSTVDDLARFKARIALEVAARKQAGIGAAGEGPDTLPFVADLRGVDQFRKLASLLAARGFTPSRIEKILGGNFLRFARDVWGA
jgi:membrane dipeptidase